jgi:outer membrane receptor protein involved in Fe transport
MLVNQLITMECKNQLTVQLFVLLSVISSASFCQVRVSGNVISKEIKALPNSNILLLDSKDSSLVRGTVSDSQGDFQIGNVAAGSYKILVSCIGFSDHYSHQFTVSGTDLKIGQLMMETAMDSLKMVTVTSKKLLFEQKIDRMVVNVKNSITNAGSTVLDVLEKSPGIQVNRGASTIAMNGKDGVLVMINGRINYMPVSALMEFLQSINASNVEKIELITNPPAQYDAEGNAGMINIVLINNPDEGFNGIITASMGIGAKEGTKPMFNTSFNLREGKLNLYASYSYSRLAQLQYIQLERTSEQKSTTQSVNIITNRDPSRTVHNYRIGADYRIDKKNTIGILAGGYNSKWQMEAINNSWSYVNNQPDTAVIINNQEINHWKHWMTNFNFLHQVREGEEISFNIDYLHYNDFNPTDYQNQFYNGANDFLYNENMSSSKETDINIWAGQLDYTKKLNEKNNIQAGGKIVFSKFSNDVQVSNETVSGWETNPRYTALYHLKENIAAAYISIDRKISNKTNAKLGLRFEQTLSNLGSNLEKDIVDRKYGQLFPTFYISHKWSDDLALNFSYSRRINRPTFNDLAPFLIFADPKTFVSGNPALQPALSNNVKSDVIWKKFVFSLGYTYTKDPIAAFVPEIDTSNNSQIMVSRNLDLTHLVFVSINLPIDITSWWSSQVSVGGYWEEAKASFKNGPINVHQLYYNISGAESFKFPKKFSFEISGFYQSASLFGQGRFEPLGALNAAVQKKIMEDKVALSLGVNDIFSTMKYVSTTSYPSEHIESKTSLQMSYRMCNISATWKFGNKALKDKRERETASEEERKRVE